VVSHLSQSRMVGPQLTHEAGLLLQSPLSVANLTSHPDSD